MTPYEFENELYIFKNKQYGTSTYTLISLLLACKLVFSHDPNESISVDGKNLTVNLDWYSQWAEDQRLFLLLHEAYHLFLGHPKRGVGKIPNMYNIASDLYINTMLTHKGFVQPTEGITLETMLERKYSAFDSAYEKVTESFEGPFDVYEDWLKDLTTDDIYKLILESKADEQKEMLEDLGKEGSGGHQQGDMSDKIANTFNYTADSKLKEEMTANADMQQLIEEAMKQRQEEIEKDPNSALQPVNGRLAGNSPGTDWLFQLIPSIGYELLDWKELLKASLRYSMEKMSTYMYPSRRNFAIQRASGTRCVLPTNRLEQKKNTSLIHIWIDVSGSVSRVKLQAVLSELNDLTKSLPSNELRFYFFNTGGNADSNFYRSSKHKLPDIKSLNVCIGGGTNFEAIYDRYFERSPKTKWSTSFFLVDKYTSYEMLEEPDICVVITDGEAYFGFENSDKMIGKEMYWIIDSTWWNQNKEGFKPDNTNCKVIYRKLT